MSKMRLTREYPNYNGVPAPFYELELPLSVLDLDKQENYNNHHWCFTARAFGVLAISQTFRDLSIFQSVEAKDRHGMAHYLYEPPKQMPSLIDMVDIIDEQRAQGGLLRYGSARFPTYKAITPELWSTLMNEYNEAA
jgi:hypothetical protein